MLKRTNAKINAKTLTISEENIDVLFNAPIEPSDYISEEEFEEKPKTKKAIRKVIKKNNIVESEVDYLDEDIIILQNENKKIKYVAHLADIHIKKRERETEFREVFNKLLESFKQNNLNNTNSIIVVAGDVIDNGIDLHPRSVRLTKDFIILMAEIADVIVISGNHDLSKQNDEDNGLSSIIYKTKTKNEVYFLENQGLYEYNNIIFGHTKFCDKEVVQSCNIKTDKIKCGLYHGTLNNSKIETGIKFTNDGKEKKYLSVGDFNDYDYVFLGDIHKHQFLTNRIAYPGSVLQLDQSESLVKGYILWDFTKGGGNFIQIKNNYARVKINIDEKGKPDIDIKILPKYVDVDIECRSMNRKHIDDLYSKMNIGNITIGKKIDRLVCDQNVFDTKIKIGGKNKDLILIKNKDDVINLLISKLDEKMDKKIVTELKNILEELLKNYKFDDASTKKHIKLKNLKFNNMAIYGENNFIDFTRFNGIVGLSDLNSSGKSSFVDIILMSVFGECTRGSRRDMINSNKKGYKCEIEIEVNNILYKVIRNVFKNSEKKNRRNDVREEIIFFENGKNIAGKSITETQKLITQKIGTMYDFIVSCFVTQKAMSKGVCIGFEEMTTKERKILLCKVARLDVYDFLSSECSTLLSSARIEIGKLKNSLNKKYGNSQEEIGKCIEDKIKKSEEDFLNFKKLESLLRLDKENFQKICSKLEVEIKNTEEKINENKDECVCDDNTFKNIINTIKKLEKEIHSNCDLIDKKKLEYEKRKKEMSSMGDIKEIEKKFKQDKKNKISEMKDTIKEMKSKINKDISYDYSEYDKKIINTKISVLDKQIKNIFDDNEKMKSEIVELNKIIKKKIVVVSEVKVNEYNKKTIELQKLTDNLTNYEEDLKKYEKDYASLKDHEYDEKCEYCMKNTITKEKLYLEKLITEIKKNIKVLSVSKNTLVKFIEKNKSLPDEYDEYVKLLNDKKDAENKCEMYKKDIDLFEIKLENLEKEKKNLQIINEGYAKYLNNKKIEKEIEKKENDIEIQNNLECNDVEKYNTIKTAINNASININELELENEKNKNEINKYNIEKEKNERSKKILDEIKNIKIKKNKLILEFDVINEKFNNVQEKISEIQKKMQETNEELCELKQHKKTYLETCDNIKKAEQKKDNYAILDQILKKDGGIIDTIMIKNLLPKFNELVNELLMKFGNEKVEMMYDNSGVIIRDRHDVDVVKNGGFQSYLNNLIYRIAIAQLNSYMSTDFMIIDEVCDSADVEKKKEIKKFIDYIKTKYKWALIISHDEDVKDTFGMMLKIKKDQKMERNHKIEHL